MSPLHPTFLAALCGALLAAPLAAQPGPGSPGNGNRPAPAPDYYAINEGYSTLNMDAIIQPNQFNAAGGWNTGQALDWLENEGYGKPILRRQDLPNVTIQFKMQRPMPRRDVVTAIESLLAFSGVSIVEFNEDYMMAVQAAQAQANAVDYLSVDADAVKGTQKYFSKIYHLDYIELQQAQPVVQNFVSSGIPIVPFQRSNAFLVTDSVRNLQRIEQVLEEIDNPPDLDADSLLFFALENTAANEVRARVEGLINQNTQLGRSLQGTTISVDERTNKLMVVTHPSNAPVIEKIIDEFDIDVAPLTSSEVFTVQHADAPDVADIIQQVVSGQQQVRQQLDEPQTTASGAQRQQQQPQAPQLPNQQAAAAPQTGNVASTVSEAAGEAQLQFSEYVTIVADERSNSIVAYGTQSDLAQIGELITKIDVLLAQVLIEVVIAEVTLNEDDARGIDSFDIEYNTAGFVDDIGFNVDANSTSRLGAPFDFSGSVEDFSIAAVIGTAQRKSNVRVLSAPNIVTTHNEEANIIVGESRPVITSSISDIDNPGSTSSSVSFRDIGIELTVTPRIGANGIIQLELTQTVETVTGTVTIDGNEQPIIGRREAQSFVSVSDRETIFLGGLQEYNVTRTNNRLALLGRLPLVGGIFGGRTDEDTRRELVIFIKPYVVDTPERQQEIFEREMQDTDARKEVEQYLERGTFDLPEAIPPEDAWEFKSRRRF
jgi:general secretion pathway protein D